MEAEQGKNKMITKEKLDSWFEKKEQVIEYDGRYCTSRCNNDIDCPHEELWAKHLANIFEREPFEIREKIVKYLSEQDFDDLVTEIYTTHCHECLGTGESGENEDGRMMKCFCKYEAEQIADAEEKWKEDLVAEFSEK